MNVLDADLSLQRARAVTLHNRSCSDSPAVCHVQLAALDRELEAIKKERGLIG